MKKILLLLLSLPLFALGLNAQTSLSIRGQLFDAEHNESVIGATVRLMTLPDSTFVKGTSTGVDGRFSFSGIKKGRYNIHVSSIGFDDYHKEVVLSDKNVNLGKISLSISSTLLSEVTVTGQASPVTLKQDTVQFNTDAFRVRRGASVEDLLRRIPGMEVDDEGNVSYNGEAIERVELDGRNFFSNDPRMATRNLPSDMIKNLQVVDKKSEETRLTGMDNGEKVKVLNLVVKEDKKGGVIANSNVGYGTKDRYKADALVNVFDNSARYTIIGNINNVDGVRRGRGDVTTRRIGGNYDNRWGDKLQITSELYYSDNDDKRFGDKSIEQLLGGTARNFQQEAYDEFRNAKRANFNSRIEWTPGEKTMMVIEPDINWTRNTARETSNFTTTNDQGVLINKGNSQRSDQADAFSLGAVLHFRHTFNERGRNLYSRVWGNYNNGRGEGMNHSLTEFLLPGSQSVLDQLTNSSNNQVRIGANLAYLEPLADRWALQVFYRIDYQRRNNEQLAYVPDAQNQYTILDKDYSRGAWNNNLNHRIGVQLRYSFWGKSQLYVGAQANPTYTHTITTQGLTETFNRDRTVWNYSPNVMLELKPNNALNLNIRYRGMTSHPSMEQLNPAVIILSPLLRTQGNPDLLPSFSHSVNINGYFNDQNTRRNFHLMGNWNYTQNGVAMIQTIDKETGARTTTYENVNGNQLLRAGFMFNTPIGGPNSKFSSATFGHVMMNKDKGFVNGIANTSTLFRPNIFERITWRGDKLQATLGGFWAMQSVVNSFSTDLDRLTNDYNVFGEVIWHLPWDISLSSRVTYQDANGYDDGMKRNFWLWDATISKSFLKGKNATIELSGYDILQQRTSIQRRISSNAITDTSVNGVMSYMMLTFSYRFNNMGAGGNNVGQRMGQFPGGGFRGRGGGSGGRDF